METKKHIRFDWAAKKILRSKANFGILEGFLSELLCEDITIKSLLSEESNKESEDDKSNRVDLLIENSKGEIIIVEIQNSRELDYLFRVLFGASKVITEYMQEGMPYSYVKKVITVSIIYFNFGQGKDYLYKGQTIFEGINEHDIFQLSDEQKALFTKKSVEDIFPEHYLIRVNSFNNNAKNSIDEWIYFFKNSEIKDEFKAKGLAEAREKLKTVNMDKQTLSDYKHYLDKLSSDASLTQTLKFEIEYKAKMDSKIEIAKEMIIEGESNNKIIKYTKLTESEIDNLRNELKK
jgi:predicted transposase/invertase (TIGR01784 family)